MPDPSQFPGGPVYGTGPDYRIHQTTFHSYQMKTYDKVHRYDKAHQPLKTHIYDHNHVYNKIRPYTDVQEYTVKEYKPRFYTAPKPPRPRAPTPTPRRDRPRTPDYKWAQLYHCYEEPLGPEILLKDYKCHEYRGREYKPIMKEYRPQEMKTLSGVQGIYQGNVDYKLTKDNYYPFRKRRDITKDLPEKYVKKPKQEKPQKKEKSVASLKHVDIKENRVNEERKVTPVRQVTSPERSPIRDESPPHPAPIVVAEKREKSPERERTFVNEAERNGLAVGTSVVMVSASTGTDDLTRKKRCSRWTQTTPISSPESSIREMTPVEIVKRSAIVGVPNNKRAETPAKPASPEPSPQPTEEQQPLPNHVAPASVVIAGDHRRRRSPSPSSRRSRRRSLSPRSRSPSPRHRSPSPRRYYRNSPTIMPLAGFAAGAVVGGTVVGPVKNHTPTPKSPKPEPKEKIPSPKPDSAGSRVVPASAVVIGGAVIKDNETKPSKSKTPSPSPKKTSPSPVKGSPSPGPDSPTIVPIVPLKASTSRNSTPSKEKDKTPKPTDQTTPDVVPVITVAATVEPEPSPVKDNTPPPSSSVSLQSIENPSQSSPVTAPVIIPVATTAEVEPTKTDNPPPEIPKKDEVPERSTVVSPRPYETTDSNQPEPSRRGLPPEVVAALEAYDNVHKKTFGEQVSENSPVSAPSSSNLPPEVVASVEAYSKMLRR